MSPRSIGIRTIVVISCTQLLAGAGLPQASAAALSPSATETAIPLERVVSPDGTLPKSLRGSVDPSGWTMTTDFAGTPRFLRDPSSPAASSGNASITAGPDDCWESRFGGSMNGQVTALVLDGAGNLFVGGFFTIAGGVPSNMVAKL